MAMIINTQQKIRFNIGLREDAADVTKSWMLPPMLENGQDIINRPRK